jgi:hypothetical protein
MELLTMAHALPAASSDIVSSDIDIEAPAAAVRAPASGPTLMRRVFDAIIETQTRRAQREIDRVLGRGALETALKRERPPLLR